MPTTLSGPNQFFNIPAPLKYAIPIAITFASAAVEAQKVKAIKRGRARKCYYMFGFMKYCSKFMFFTLQLFTDKRQINYFLKVLFLHKDTCISTDICVLF